MKLKIMKNISDLILDDESFFCYINPFINNKFSPKNKSEKVAPFIEKNNKISIKINRSIKKKINSLVIKEDQDKEKQANKRIKKLRLYNFSPPPIKTRNIKLFKFKSKKDEIPNLIPLSLKKNKSNYKLNFFDDYEKNFFFEEDYSGLVYNASDIFENKSKYKQTIIDRVKQLKKGVFDKKTIKFEKKFRYGINKKEVNLTLSTLTISLEDMALPADKQNPNLKLNLPIALLPLFYFKGINPFKKLLADIIIVENNFEKISFSEKDFNIALNNIPDYRTNEVVTNDSNISIKNLKNEDLKSPILLRNGNFLSFNNFIFFWVTNSKSLVCKITLPCIHLDILENRISIKNYIDYELLFFLFEKNFEHWEFYVIKYLSTYSKYRNIFEQLDNNDKNNNQTFFFKEPKIKINTFAQEIVVNLYTDLKNKNHVLTFSSFYIIVDLIDEIHNLKKKYRIYFSFDQYVKLYEISKYSNKIGFLSKFLQIDIETHSLTFNFKEYDEFDTSTWMENMKIFSGGSIKKHKDNNIDEELYNEFEIYHKKVKVEFKKPLWSIIKLENSREVVKEWEIGNEMESLLIECISRPSGDIFTRFLNECLKKIDEPYEEIKENNHYFKKRTGKYIK